jgi:hypothetical protein
MGKLMSETLGQRLRCGTVVLSEADNWYVPGRWRPPTSGGRAAQLPISPKLLEHRALLTLPDGTPFSEVVETYTENVLAFPLPKRRGAL